MVRNRRAPLRRTLASVLTGALIASAAVVGIAVPSHAADAPVGGATLSWGVKQSFVNYLRGPIAHGSITTGGGATGTYPFAWSGGTGIVDDSSFVGSVSYPGDVHFSGHDGLLDLRFANPRIQITSATAATLYLDVNSVAFGENPAIDQDAVPFASLTLPAPSTGENTVTWTSAPAVLTAEGAAAFAGFYSAGTALDALSFTVPYTPAAPEPVTTITSLAASPVAESQVGASVTLTATVTPAAAGTVEFFDGESSLGSSTVASGAASISTSSLTVGSHSLTAAFTPSDAVAHAASSSAAVTYSVTSAPQPQTPAVVVSKTADLDAAGETVDVAGEGFVTVPPATDATRPPLTGSFGGTYVQFGYYVGETWTAAPRSPQTTKWAVLESDLGKIGGAAAGGIVVSADGAFATQLTVSELDAAPAEAAYGIRTFAGGGATYAPFSTFTEIEFADAAPAPTPTLSVSQTSGLDPEGATITITGENYSTDAQAIHGPSAGQPAGVYAQIGWLAGGWRPSEGAAAATRSNAYSVWVQGVNSASPYLQWTDNGDGTADFTWEVEIDKAALDAKRLDGATLAVFTVGAGGVVQAANEQSVAISFAEPAPAPSITVAPNADLDPTIENVLTITGENFAGPGAVNGAYVLFGETSVWSGDGPLPSAGWIAQGWVMPRQIVDGRFTTTLTVPAGTLLASGTYQVATSAAHALSITDRSLDAFAAVSVAQGEIAPSIFLSSGSVAQGGALEVRGAGFPSDLPATVTVNSDPITLGTAVVGENGSFTVSGAVPADFPVGAHTVVATAGDVTVSQALTVTAAPAPATVVPTEQPSCVARAVAGATFQWSVKESFRNYIQGPIAHGSYSIDWAAGSGAYSTETDRGRVAYGGSAHFTGHNGLLDLTIANPRVQVHGTSTASLIVDVRSTATDGSTAVDANGVVFATLSLPAVSETAGRISWSGAAATLTAAGAEAFAGFYPAGTPLDPVSFAFPLGSEVDCDSTTTGNLAATGGESPIDLLWVSVTMLLLGAGVFVIRRRTARV